MTSIRITELQAAEPASSAALRTETACRQGNTTHIDCSQLEGLRALLVEDSWHVAVAIKTVLENVGVIVEGPAGSLARARSLMTSAIPDVAVVDINLKGKMAYDLIDELSDEGVPVIVVSGYEDLSMLDGRVAATLGKPVRAGALLTALHRAVATR